MLPASLSKRWDLYANFDCSSWSLSWRWCGQQSLSSDMCSISIFLWYSITLYHLCSTCCVNLMKMNSAVAWAHFLTRINIPCEIYSTCMRLVITVHCLSTHPLLYFYLIFHIYPASLSRSCAQKSFAILALSLHVNLLAASSHAVNISKRPQVREKQDLQWIYCTSL